MQDIVNSLHAEVRNMYESCGFDFAATPTTLFMIGDLEARLEDLLAINARISPAHMMKAKKERANKKREWKLSQQEAIQKNFQVLLVQRISRSARNN